MTEYSTLLCPCGNRASHERELIGIGPVAVCDSCGRMGEWQRKTRAELCRRGLGRSRRKNLFEPII